MAVLDAVLGGLDATSVIIFIVVFLIAYYWLTTPRNLPPGPTGLPVVGNLVSLIRAGPNTLDLLKKWHQQYGDVFTIRMGGFYMVVISSHKMLHDAFVKQADVFSNRATSLHVWKTVAETSGSGVAMTNGRVWKELRRVTLSSLKDFGLGKKSLEQHVREQTHTIVRMTEEGQGQPVYIRDVMCKFTTNIICCIVLGSGYDYEDTFLTQLIEALNKANSELVTMTVVDFLPFLKYVPSLNKGIDRLAKNILAVRDLLETTLKQHEETYDPGQVRDFIDLYIKTRKETEDTHLFNHQNMWRVIMDLLLGGADTTATTLDWIVLYLIAYPDVQTRCQQDIDRVIGHGRLVTMEDRKDLPYIQAVISEVLRIATIGPLGLPHETEKETKLVGYTIPAKTIVVGNVHEIHHNPDLWPEPFAFKPERFLDKDGQFCSYKDGHIPFSLGPRVCLGEPLARMELFIMLTSLMQSFTFTMAQSQKPDFEGHVGVVYSAKPQPLFATRR